MNFTEWTVDRLLESILGHGIDPRGVLEDLKSESLLAMLRKRFEAPSGEVDLEKAKEAVRTLRGVLLDPENREILDHISREVARLGGPRVHKPVGDGMFKDWLKNRMALENLQQQVDPQEKLKNQTVSNVTSSLMKKNPRSMVPGSTKPQDVASAIKDPVVLNQPNNVKQGVAQFLQGNQKNNVHTL